jgi:phage/plasmid-associated DNA primase
MNDEIDDVCLYDWVGKDGEKAISALNLYEQYKGWCSSNGEKAWSNKSVGTELKNKKLYREKDKKKYNNEARWYYQF